MAQERLHLHLAHVQVSLRKIREVLRLKHEVDLSNRAIARACRVSKSTVGDCRFAAYSGHAVRRAALYREGASRKAYLSLLKSFGLGYQFCEILSLRSRLP